jgi:ferredoxin
MDLYSFVEGPLLWVVFLLFLTGFVVRFSFFLAAILRSSRNRENRATSFIALLGRFLLPLHNALSKKPLYTSLRYAFHVCLFIVPIWLSGHIVLWSESRFEWDWTPLPEAVADGMTLFCLALAVYFLLRRLLSRKVRQVTSVRDIVLIVISAMPFCTGYFLKYGTLDVIPALGDNMAVIHMMSGELMILTAVLLFYSPHLISEVCVGCAACVQNCPTETLAYQDNIQFRDFNYAHFQCICCGTCIRVCPEDASELRHEINPARFFQIFSKRRLSSVKLESCQRCGVYFAPDLQMKKIISEFNHEYTKFCPNCRKTNTGDRLFQLSPWHKKTSERDDGPKETLSHRHTP